MFKNLNRIPLTAIYHIDSCHFTQFLSFLIVVIALTDVPANANLNKGFKPDKKRKAPGNRFSFLFPDMPEYSLLAKR